jgi:hypothetical protein
VAGLLGMGWAAVTYFVVPVLVVEKVGPVEAVKRSFSVLRRTWGEALTANFGIGIITFLMSLVGVIPLILGVVMLSSGGFLGGLLIGLGIFWLLLVSLVSSALNAIVIAALYLYAAEGTVPKHFDDGLFRHAFRHH